jgi:hypothetical protein
MKPSRWWYAATPALTGVIAGWYIIARIADPITIGATLLVTGAIGYGLYLGKQWVTDTTYEKERLRLAIASQDEARNQALAGRALQVIESERQRADAEATKREADERVAEAEQRAAQAVVNADQRALAAEARAQEWAQRCIAEEFDRLRREAAEQYARLKTESFAEGARAVISGDLEAILNAPRSNVVHLEDHRPTITATGTGDH